jgi:fumarate hydratase class II
MTARSMRVGAHAKQKFRNTEIGAAPTPAKTASTNPNRLILCAGLMTAIVEPTATHIAAAIVVNEKLIPALEWLQAVSNNKSR